VSTIFERLLTIAIFLAVVSHIAFQLGYSVPDLLPFLPSISGGSST
jgi:hypothetical protein